MADPTFLQLVQETAPELPDGDVERSFLQNITTSFARGQESVLADVAIYEALSDPNEDLTGALIARNKMLQRAALDPVEGRYLTGLVFKAAGTAGQMFESAKRAAVGSVLGAATGAAAGGVIGAVVPTVGEEPVTVGGGVALGAKLGAKISGHGAAGVFMYKQGVGAMYADMIAEGIDPKIAERAARLGAVPYAALELAQLKMLGAPAKRVLTGKAKALLRGRALEAIGAGLKVYTKTLAGEVTEELAQEMVQIGTERGARAFQEGGLTLDREWLDSTVDRMWQVGKGSVEAFALLPVPGATLEAGVAWASAQLDNEISAKLADVDNVNTVQVKDVSDPQAQLYLALRQRLGEAIEVNEVDERASYRRHVERAQKAGRQPMDQQSWSVQYRSKKLLREQEAARREERKERLGAMAGNVRAQSNGLSFSKNLKRALKGKTYTSLGIEPLESVLPIETFNTLRNEIVADTATLKHLEAMRLIDALENLYYKGGRLHKSEVKLAKKMWGPNVATLLEEIGALQEAQKLHPITTANDFARSVASSMDLSRLLRQEKFTIGKPKLFAKLAAVSAKSLVGGSPVAEMINKDLITSEAGQAAIRAGVRVEEFGPGVGFERGPEAFPSKIAGRIPGIARSQAAFAVGGNYARIMRFGEIWEANKGSLSPKDLRDIAQVINILSGIGDTRALGKYAHVLNSIFFAPRNFFANVQVWTELLNPQLSGIARKYLAWNVVKWFGINAGMLAMMSAAPGVSVERDPRSTDFGKVVLGNTHIDFWGGQLPIFRTLYRLAVRERKTQAGRIVDADMKDTISRFLQSKLGPVPAAALDMWRGETFYGAKRDPGDVDDVTAIIYDRVTPFFVQDLIDAIRYQGVVGGALAPLSFLGASAQTYPKTKSTEVALKKNQLASEMGVNWEELGPEAQKFLRQKYPEIGLMEREAKYERDHGYFLETIEKNLKRSQKKMYNAMPRDIRQELDQLNLTLSGVGRRIGTNWYLNDARYKDYENRVRDAYKEILPKLMRAPVWQRLNPVGKAEIVKKATEEIKEAVRKQIVYKAKMADLRRVRYGGDARRAGT
jgi:hypothetical protein